MDTYAAADVARGLGTTVPRVVRAAERLGLDAREPNGRWRFSRSMLSRLRDELGVTPEVPGLSPTEVKVLAALSRAPFGLSSARVVARRAVISPTAAAGALRTLEDQGLVYHEETRIAAGRTRQVTLYHANRRAERWLDLTPALVRVLPPRRRTRRDRRVPTGLRHLFWNTASSQLEVGHGGPYIARRLLTTMDSDGLAWGAKNLRASDWEHAARTRGLDDRQRALAHNLAAAA